MIAEQLLPRGISDARVLEAMSRVPRHLFVDREQMDHAYDDRPLPIGFGQTISQPYMVARATELALPDAGDVALEIGVGSGYQTAVLALLCAQVFAVDIVSPQIPVLLLDELRDGGRLVAPVGGFEQQILTRVRRMGDTFETTQDVPCRYVNLTGRYGVGRDKPQA